MKHEIWLYLSGDKYELPICIADTKKELAAMVGTSTLNINSSLCDYRRGRLKYRRYAVVEVED